MPEYQNETWVIVLIRHDNLGDLIRDHCSCRVLIGFHQKDASFEQALRILLSPLKAFYKLDVQSERTLLPGQNIENEINRLMGRCHFLLILLSPDFQDLDNPVVFNRYWKNRNPRATTIPIKIRPCDPHPEIDKLMAIPQKPIGRLKNDKAFMEVITELKRVFENYKT